VKLRENMYWYFTLHVLSQTRRIASRLHIYAAHGISPILARGIPLLKGLAYGAVSGRSATGH